MGEIARVVLATADAADPLVPAVHTSTRLARASPDQDSQAGKRGINREMVLILFSYSSLICSVRAVRNTRKPGRNELALYAMLGSYFAVLRKFLLVCVDSLLIFPLGNILKVDFYFSNSYFL